MVAMSVRYKCKWHGNYYENNLIWMWCDFPKIKHKRRRTHPVMSLLMLAICNNNFHWKVIHTVLTSSFMSRFAVLLTANVNAEHRTMYDSYTNCSISCNFTDFHCCATIRIPFMVRYDAISWWWDGRWPRWCAPASDLYVHECVSVLTAGEERPKTHPTHGIVLVQITFYYCI